MSDTKYTPEAQEIEKLTTELHTHLYDNFLATTDEQKRQLYEIALSRLENATIVAIQAANHVTETDSDK